MALIYPTIWEQGDKRERLTPGYHYKKNVASMVVPEGQCVTLYHDENLDGKKGLPMNEGRYHHLYFYGIPKRPGIVHVEENGLESLSLVDIGWYSTYDEAKSKETGGKEGRYPMHYSVPVGDRVAGTDFPNDVIQWLMIPYGVTVEVFDDKFSGRRLIFSGNIPGEKERVNMWDFNFSWKISSMKIRSDKWVMAGIEVRDAEIVTKSDEKTVASIMLANNSPHRATVSGELNAAIMEGVAEEWGIEAGVAAKTGFEAETGMMGQSVTVTGELEISLSAGYGESKTTEKARGFAITVSAELDGWGTVKVSMIAEEGYMRGKAIRKWRNTRTNAITEEPGRFETKNGIKAMLEVSGERTVLEHDEQDVRLELPKAA